MKCPKNKKKFLFFKWNGKHEYYILFIRPFGTTDKFEVIAECKYCKEQKYIADIDESMFKSVFTVEELEKIKSDIYGWVHVPIQLGKMIYIEA